MSFYLVERYVPAMSVHDITMAIARLDRAESAGVRHLWTLLIPVEDACLSVFEAPDHESVAGFNARADFPLDRIVEAFVMPPPTCRPASG